jgi:hypothetical protein
MLIVKRVLAGFLVIVLCGVSTVEAGFEWGGGQDLGTFEETFVNDIDSEASDVQFNYIKSGIVDTGKSGFLIGIGRYVRNAVGFFWDRRVGDDAVYVDGTPDRSVGKELGYGDDEFTFVNNEVIEISPFEIKNKPKVVLANKDVLSPRMAVDGLVGDLNGNGAIDILDVYIVKSFLGDESKSDDEQKFLADINKDGFLNSYDVRLMIAFGDGYIENISDGVGVIFGDLDGSGLIDDGDSLIIKGYLGGSRNLSNYERVLADVNSDGEVNLHDAIIISGVSGGLVAGSEMGNVVIGDVDNSGDLGIFDSILISRYVSRVTDFSDYEMFVGDANADGVIDLCDAKVIEKRLSGSIVENEMSGLVCAE